MLHNKSKSLRSALPAFSEAAGRSVPEEYRPLIFANGEQVPCQQTSLTFWLVECGVLASGSLSPTNQEAEGPDQEHTIAPRLTLLRAFL